MSKLSKRQNTRLGGLIAVLGGREPYDAIIKDLLDKELICQVDGAWSLTDKGVNEKDRLSILAGLMVEKDYVSHKPRNLHAVPKSQ